MTKLNEIAEKRLASLDPRILGTKIQEDLNILDPRIKDPRDQERLATYLEEKYNAPEYRPVFLRAACHLDEGTIRRIVEASEGKRSPRAYFIACAKRDRRYGKPNVYLPQSA